MESPVNLVRRFYESFARLDHAGMNNLYAPGISFFDPVFGHLQGEDVKSMWRMLCTRAQDFTLEFEAPVALDEEYVTCRWTAEYVFSGTGRKVRNVITAHMRVVDGRISEHSDAFSLHRWAAQALGWKGWLLGGFGFFQRTVRNKARKQLEGFINKGL